MSEFKDDLSGAGEAEVRSVTQAQLEEQVKYQFFFTARDGVYRNEMTGDAAEALSHVTICVLILHNGLKLVGVNTGSVDPRNFNPQMAMTAARKAAIDQLWPMLGYQLKEQMYQDRRTETVIERHSSYQGSSLEDAMKQLDADLNAIQPLTADQLTEWQEEQIVHHKNPPL